MIPVGRMRIATQRPMTEDILTVFVTYIALCLVGWIAKMK